MEQAPRRILIIRPSALGDVCRSVPVLTSLKRAFPESQIDWLVHAAFADAIAHHPDLHRVVPFERGRLGKAWPLRRDGRAAFASLMKSLRSPRYDLVLDCQGLGRSGLFAWLTGAPQRVGYADARELGAWGVNKRVPPPSSVHTVDRMLSLVEAIGVAAERDMRLYTSASDRARAQELAGMGRYTVVAPTSRWPGKRWPIERFGEVIDGLLEHDAARRFVIVASPSERDQCGGLLNRCEEDGRLIDLAGRTSVGELMAVIERADLVLANDSAALHMAVGFDRPAVALFGPTRTERVGPYLREADVLQSQVPGEGVSHKDEEAGLRLMREIATQEVIAACLERLGAP